MTREFPESDLVLGLQKVEQTGWFQENPNAILCWFISIEGEWSAIVRDKNSDNEDVYHLLGDFDDPDRQPNGHYRSLCYEDAVVFTLITKLVTDDTYNAEKLFDEAAQYGINFDESD